MGHTRVTVALLFLNIALAKGHDIKPALAVVARDFKLTEGEQKTLAFLALIDVLKSDQSAILIIPS